MGTLEELPVVSEAAELLKQYRAEGTMKVLGWFLSFSCSSGYLMYESGFQ